jgi:hypothetical protein
MTNALLSTGQPAAGGPLQSGASDWRSPLLAGAFIARPRAHFGVTGGRDIHPMGGLLLAGMVI